MGEKWKVVCEPQGRNAALVKREVPPLRPGIMDRAKAAVSGGTAVAEPPATEEVPENTGGMILYLTNGSAKQEVSRVAFVRRASKNPDVPFDVQLDREMAKARTAAKVLNESMGEGELQ